MQSRIEIEIVGRELPGARHLDPSAEGGVREPVTVGVQVGRAVVQAAPADLPEVRFHVALEARAAADGGLRFSGPFVHGPGNARFLYLCWQAPVGEGGPVMFRRLKLGLEAITPERLAISGSARVDIALTDPKGAPLCGSAGERARWTFGDAPAGAD